MRALERHQKATGLKDLSSLQTDASIDRRRNRKPVLPTAEGMSTIRAEDQLVEKTVHACWSKNDIRSIISLFELLEGWDSSHNQTSI